MTETGYYVEFAEKFSDYLKTYLGADYSIYYSVNKSLDSMINELSERSGHPILSEGIYVPKLKLDIVFSIHNKKKHLKLMLIEAKLLNQLSLKDYSQLVGYLQVGKIIDLGFLLLIQKTHSPNKLSNDLQEIVRLKKLPMDWIIQIRSNGEKYTFQTGILHYLPNNGIDWIQTPEINGVCSFEQLRELIIK